MIERFGNIWEIRKEYPESYVAITTNGFVKKDGKAVMGRGITLQASKKYKDLSKRLGSRIIRFGNQLHTFQDIKLITFPVKYSWNQPVNKQLIWESCRQLKECQESINRPILIVRPGCGNGQLDWIDVKSIMESFFKYNNNIIIVEKEEYSNYHKTNCPYHQTTCENDEEYFPNHPV